MSNCLDKLLEIARLANENPIAYSRSVDAYNEQIVYNEEINERFGNTFTPRLIEKLLAAYSAACEMRDGRGSEYTEQLGDDFDKAREALDAELRAV